MILIARRVRPGSIHSMLFVRDTGFLELKFNTLAKMTQTTIAKSSPKGKM